MRLLRWGCSRINDKYTRLSALVAALAPQVTQAASCSLTDNRVGDAFLNIFTFQNITDPTHVRVYVCSNLFVVPSLILFDYLAITLTELHPSPETLPTSLVVHSPFVQIARQLSVPVDLVVTRSEWGLTRPSAPILQCRYFWFLLFSCRDFWSSYILQFQVKHTPPRMQVNTFQLYLISKLPCHVPSTWPAIWETKESNWPYGVRSFSSISFCWSHHQRRARVIFDILKGSNDQGTNAITLRIGCNAPKPSNDWVCLLHHPLLYVLTQSTSTPSYLNCNSFVNSNAGCCVKLTKATSCSPDSWNGEWLWRDLKNVAKKLAERPKLFINEQMDLCCLLLLSHPLETPIVTFRLVEVRRIQLPRGLFYVQRIVRELVVHHEDEFVDHWLASGVYALSELQDASLNGSARGLPVETQWHHDSLYLMNYLIHWLLWYSTVT